MTWLQCDKDSSNSCVESSSAWLTETLKDQLKV